MRYLKHFEYKEGEALPEHFVKILETEVIGYHSWSTPEGSGTEYRYRIHGLFDDSLQGSKINEG